MAVTGGRVLAHLAVKLFDPGEGDPRLTDHGFAWRDPLAIAEPPPGTPELDGAGRPLVQHVPGCGLICAPVPVLQETRLAHWETTTSSGVPWEEVTPASAAPAVRRLHQVDTTAGVTWSARSRTPLAAETAVAISLILLDTPADWDVEAEPPELQIEIGDRETPGAAWAVRLEKHVAALYRWSGSAWEYARSLPPPPRSAGYGDLEELQLWLVPAGGRLLVSWTGGAEWTTIGSDAEPAQVGSGRPRLSGRGGSVLFGVHQLLLREGSWSGRPRDTLTERTAPVVTITGDERTAAGTGIGYEDLSAGRHVRYRATLTPAGSTWVGPGWTAYRTPVLRAVTCDIAPTAVAGSGAYTEPWAGRCLAVTIEKPEDLSQSTATLRVKPTAGPTGGFRRRKLLIELGYREGEAAAVTWTAFIGYIRTVSATRDRYGEGLLEIIADGPATPLRRQRWTELHVRSLAGLTVNAASDYVLGRFGIPLDSSHRVWHPWGDLTAVPADGDARAAELIRPGEQAWTTLARLQSYARLELAVSDDGVITAVPQDYTTGTAHELRTAPGSGLDLRELATGIGHRLDYDETSTAVLVSGTDAGGERIWAWAVDEEAENQPLSDRFCPWREVEQDVVPGAGTPAALTGRAQLLAQQRFGLAYQLQAPVHLHDTISRRDSVLVYGAAAEGIPDGTEYVVTAMRHHVEVRPDGTALLETDLGLRRL